MNRLDELIKEMCPNGVEYRRAEAVIESITTGLNPRKNFSLNTIGDSFPYITGKDIYDNKVIVSEKTDLISKDVVELINKRAKLQNDIILFASTGTGTVGRMAYVEKYDSSWNVSESLYVIKPNNQYILTKYLMYSLMTTYSRTQYEPKISKGSVPHLKIVDLKKVIIPIPPLEIQEKIVKILDKFTNYVTELQAELQARMQQYEHYREQLTQIGKIKLLDDIAYYPKERIGADLLDEDHYVGVENLLQNKMGKSSSKCVPVNGKVAGYKKDDILVGNIRPYLKKIWHANNDGGTNGDVIVLRAKNSSDIFPRYLYHVLASDRFFQYNMNNAKGAKMPRGDKQAVLKFDVYVPAYNEQKRIAGLLDKFDSLCSDIITGLPAEIEARQKQYEYYRDKLLTFKELS